MGAIRAPKFLLQPQVFAGFNPAFPRPCFAFVASLGLYDLAGQRSGTRASGDVIRTTLQGWAYKVAQNANGGLDFGTCQPITSDAFTIIAIANAASADGISTQYSQRAGSPNNTQIDFLLNSANTTDGDPGRFALFTGNSSEIRAAHSTSTSLVNGQFHVYGAVKADIGSVPDLWYSGAKVAASALSNGSAASSIHSAQQTKIGNIGDYSGSGYCSASDISLVLCFNSALSNAQMRALTESLVAPYLVFQAPPRRVMVGGSAAPVIIAAGIGNAVAEGASASIAHNISVVATVGNAASDGTTARIAANRTIGCAAGDALADGARAAVNIVVSGTVGQALADGAAASVSVTIGAAAGQATAAGLTASMSVPATVTTVTGNAAATGQIASIQITVTLPASVGAAVANGYGASVFSGFAIPAAVADAIANGQVAGIFTNPAIYAGIGSAVADGWNASILFGTIEGSAYRRYTIPPEDRRIVLNQR